MEYNFSELEPRWQKYWKEEGVYHVENGGEPSRPNGSNGSVRPHFYVLDMFPYPSGAGLHVGHPLGYIASDIYARYKRLRGYNVLHPMGYDAYGLPAEQYAIQTGQHPAVTTEKNIARYREQLDKIGFSFDWDREVRTCDPKYYKWTQWTFIQLFNSYYCNQARQARPISELVEVFAKQGTEGLDLACTEEMHFSADEWNCWDEAKRQQVLMNYRLAYLADTYVNWCAELGTVLANDEVVGGLSVRGGYPVERKLMRQWSLRISAYAQRLVDGLEQVDWTDSLKEIQRNWIGRSEGAAVWFPLAGTHSSVSPERADSSPNIGEHQDGTAFEIFTTRPDTIFGVTFMVLCPEHELIGSITTPEQKAEVEAYVTWAKNRSERERQAEVKKVSGVFTGAFAVNPLTEEKIPIYVSDYVLAGYGTGAIMAVPAHDSRDFAFARHFGLPIRQVVSLEKDVTSDPATWSESMDAKTGYSVNSGFVTGMKVKEAMAAVIDKIEEMGIGHRTVNFRLRDAIFSRQRYWGEPFPIYYKSYEVGGKRYEVACAIPEECLPLELPEVSEFKPTATGEPPLGHAKRWAWDTKTNSVVDVSDIDNETVFPLELSTMPGFAGSSGYYLRYMDPTNDKEYFSESAVDYWQNVDLYVGGAEHGTGHLIYARFWNKFLFDLGLAKKEEPFQKLINQGMIQGRSNFVYRSKADNNLYISKGLIKSMDDVTPIHVDINIVDNDVLDVERFREWRPEFKEARFELEDGKYICGWEVEKMSKSMFNVQNPDDLVARYGADTLRLYEMFLGPVEQAKPWDTNGIEGVHRFLKKFWKLYDNCLSNQSNQNNPSSLKTLHQTIKKITDDIERFSFNTAVSTFMICVNTLTDQKCASAEVLKPLAVLLAPFAPHIAEEVWHGLGGEGTVCDAEWPVYDEKMLVEDTVKYPVQFNGKMRFMLELPAAATQQEALEAVKAAPESAKWMTGEPKKVIFVPKKIINIVC
ncbi:MAG: leucine--tRNA ligase [Bacteroidales bacterium]|nr:leucine--tRNA ligase [Bacteroidales bacterium]